MSTHSGEGSTQLDIVGCEVDACILDYAFTLRLAATDSSGHYSIKGELRIETAFTFAVADGVLTCDPGSDPVGLGPALRLVRQRVVQAHTAPDDTLCLFFSDGSRLVVAPHPDYEAWILSMTSGAIIICVPGGSTTAFPAREP